jgi:predicted MFS family arabinose efflux permease
VTSAPASRQFHWWTIVLAAAAIAAIGMGLRQVMGLYMKPITMELAIGRQGFSLAIAIANLVWGLAAPFVGAISDRYGAGRVGVMGGVMTALGLYATYAAQSEAGLLLAGVFLGLGVAGAGVNAMVGAVARAAPIEQRTQAIAALGIGSGLGILIALPYTHLLIEALTWKGSLLALLVTSLAILPLAYVVAGKPRPVQLGPQASSQSVRVALHEAFQTPSYYLLNAGFFVCGFHLAFYGTHLPAYVADQGLSPSVSVMALTAVGAGNLIGTWASGQSARYFPKRYGLSVIYALRAVVFLGFLVLPVTPAFVIIASFLLGLLWLSTIPLTSGLVATFFGAQWMTMLYGIVFLSHQIGSFLGAWSAGLIFDATKSYDTMWWISIALGLFAAVVHIPIREEAVLRPAVAQPAE